MTGPLRVKLNFFKLNFLETVRKRFGKQRRNNSALSPLLDALRQQILEEIGDENMKKFLFFGTKR